MKRCETVVLGPTGPTADHNAKVKVKVKCTPESLAI